VRLLGWALILLGVLLLWPLGGILAFLLGLLLVLLGLLLAPVLLVLAIVLLPLVLALALGAALLKVLWPVLLIAIGVWLVLHEGGEQKHAD